MLFPPPPQQSGPDFRNRGGVREPANLGLASPSATYQAAAESGTANARCGRTVNAINAPATPIAEDAT